MRIVLARLAAVVALGAVALGVVVLSAGDAEAKPAAHYVVRPDPRLCPSPLCGGYWVSLANHSRTRCHDGLYRPRCYVASAWPETRTIQDGALVRGGIAVQSIQGLGELGLLVAADVRNPVGSTAFGSFLRLRDIGVLCIREPCFSIRATRLNGVGSALVSGIDVSQVKPAVEEEATLALFGDGLFAAGRIASTDDGGRVFRASRVYFRASRPRA